VVGIVSSYGRRSEFRIPSMNKRFFSSKTVQTGSGAHRASYSVGNGVTSRGMKLTTHLHLVLRLRMSGAAPLLPVYTFMAWTGTVLPIPFNDDDLRLMKSRVCG